MDEIVKEKCESMLLGEKVIMSDKDMDEIIPYRLSNYVASIHNPNRVGILDAYIAWIKHPQRIMNPWEKV